MSISIFDCGRKTESFNQTKTSKEKNDTKSKTKKSNVLKLSKQTSKIRKDNNLYLDIKKFIRSNSNPTSVNEPNSINYEDTEVLYWVDGNTLYWYCNKDTVLCDEAEGFSERHIKNVNLEGLIFNKCRYMFKKAENMQSIKNIFLENCEDATGLLLDVKTNNLTIENFDVSSIKDADSMFRRVECNSLKCDNLNFANINNFSGMFTDAKIENISIKNWTIGNQFRKLYSRRTMFEDFETKKLDLSTWDVSSINDFSYFFYECNAKELYLNGWNVSNGEKFNNMFDYSGCETIDISNWDMSNAKDTSNMFSCCFNLKNIDVSRWDVS